MKALHRHDSTATFKSKQNRYSYLGELLLFFKQNWSFTSVIHIYSDRRITPTIPKKNGIHVSSNFKLQIIESGEADLFW